MKQFFKENWFKVIMAGCAIIVAFTYVWFTVIEQSRENRLTQPNEILRKYGIN